MKKLLAVIGLITALIFSLSINTLAASTSFTIDNDTIDSTCKNMRVGFSVYATGNSQYNGDCRRESISNKSAWYSWTCSSKMLRSNSPIKLKAGIYLNNVKFTDPQARYYVEQRDGGYFIGTINQNTARAGWNYISYTINTNNNTPGSYSVEGLMVTPSGINMSGYTGADAISISATT